MTSPTLTADDVRVFSTGYVAAAPDGTTLPSDATTSLNAAFHELGYIDDKGVIEEEKLSTNKIKAWQNGDVVRVVQTEHELTYKFRCIETNRYVLAAFYGQSYDGVVEITGTQPVAGCWVVHVIDGSDLIRIVIPSGQLSDKGPITYASGDAVGYEFTITCYSDATGVKAYKYLSGPDS